MKIVRIAIYVIVALFLVITLIGYLLPSKLVIEESISIKAAKITVFNELNSFQKFNNWSPWAAMDTSTKWEIWGNESGVNAQLKWESKNSSLGIGSQQIIESVPYSYIKILLIFGEDSSANAYFKFDEKDDETIVTWGYEAPQEFVYSRYMGLLSSYFISSTYKEGLANLKELIENLYPLPVNMQISEPRVRSLDAVVIRHKTSKNLNEIADSLTSSMKQLDAFFESIFIKPDGSPMLINRSSDENSYEFEVGYPIINNTFAINPNMKYITTYEGKTIRLTYTGPLSKLKSAYDAADKYVKDNKFEKNGDSWEMYLSNPLTTKPEELVTQIFIPVK